MTKMTNTWLLALAFALIASLTSCGVWNLNNKVKHLELGMTKQEVFNVLGNTYISEGAIATPEGSLETIRFSGANATYTVEYAYIVRFLDGKLVEWFNKNSENTPVPIPVPVPIHE